MQKFSMNKLRVLSRGELHFERISLKYLIYDSIMGDKQWFCILTEPCRYHHPNLLY